MENALAGVKGRTKAAILLAFLPREVARQIGEYLDPLEIEIIGKEMLSIEETDPAIMEAVLQEFVSYMKGDNYGNVRGGIQGVVEIFGESLGAATFDEILKRIYRSNSRPFDSLKKFTDIGPLLTFLHTEDPQTIAIVVMHMKPSLGAQLVEGLSERKRYQVFRRLARMDQANKDILEKLENHLESKLETYMGEESTQTDGVKILVNILNNVPRSTERSFFDRLDSEDGKLAETIRNNMFVFEDIVKLDMFMLQKVVSSVDNNELLAKALKLAKEEIKEKFLAAMPDKRRAIIMDVSDGLMTKRSEAEEAQQTIANIVKELEKKGEIAIQRGDEDVILA
ncbi:flagellar motor switch protein FliG [Bacillus bombysepticus]|uniref:flagellar motor switch protein FliG n=1 Tax=Bacillus bombysepticus TaxID=658666 RepID=UPI0030193899